MMKNAENDRGATKGRLSFVQETAEAWGIEQPEPIDFPIPGNYTAWDTKTIAHVAGVPHQVVLDAIQREELIFDSLLSVALWIDWKRRQRNQRRAYGNERKRIERNRWRWLL